MYGFCDFWVSRVATNGAPYISRAATPAGGGLRSTGEPSSSALRILPSPAIKFPASSPIASLTPDSHYSNHVPLLLPTL